MRVLVEVEDFVNTARDAYDGVAVPLSRAAVCLSQELFAVGGMAGDDAHARDWAREYDVAAARAVGAFAGVVDACFRLASLFGQSGRNYAQADAYSTAGDRSAIVSLLPRLPRDASFSALAPPPGAVGPGDGFPDGWGLLHDISGYLWPNGHQDRLHRAGRAWSAASAAVHTAAGEVEILPILFTGHRLPEAADVDTVCSSMARHLRDLGHVFATLAQACAQFADAIDWAHAEIAWELEETGVWIAATEAAAAGTAWCTFGISEGVAAGIVWRKLVTTSADVAAILVTFATRVGRLVLKLPPVRDLADDIAFAAQRIQNAQVVRPALVGVPNLPAITRVARTGGGEIGATQRLAVPPVAPRVVGRKLGDRGVWGNPRTLARHFKDHGKDFNATTAEVYSRQASNFLEYALKERLPMKVDNDGVIRVWDPDTDAFGSYNADGSTRTFFKPSRPIQYWANQPGVLR